MKKNLSRSRSEEMLTTGGGGLSALKAQPQQSRSLAQGESQKQFSALAQQGQAPVYTPPGDPSLKTGEKSVLTAPKELTIPNLTLAASANWALTLLRRRGLVEFVLNEERGRYEVHFPVSTWRLIGNNVLTLNEGETK